MRGIPCCWVSDFTWWYGIIFLQKQTSEWAEAKRPKLVLANFAKRVSNAVLWMIQPTARASAQGEKKRKKDVVQKEMSNKHARATYILAVFVCLNLSVWNQRIAWSVGYTNVNRTGKIGAGDKGAFVLSLTCLRGVGSTASIQISVFSYFCSLQETFITQQLHHCCFI